MERARKLFLSPLYNTQLFAILVSLQFFNVLDVHFTMLNLKLGAYEANPLMQPLLEGNFTLFLFYKYFFVCAASALCFLLADRPRMKTLFYSISGLYSSLVIYQVVLFMRLSWP